MLALRAVRAVSFSVFPSVKERNIGIAVSGLTTENSEVKLATNRAPAPIIWVEKGIISLKNSSISHQRYAPFYQIFSISGMLLSKLNFIITYNLIFSLQQKLNDYNRINITRRNGTSLS